MDGVTGRSRRPPSQSPRGGTMGTEMIQIERPAPPEIVARIGPIVQAARSFAVVDVETNTIALERIRDLRGAERLIVEAFEPSRKAADAAKKEILALRDGLVGPISAARAIYDASASQYE